MAKQSRSPKDPRVLRVMRAIDTVIASPHAGELLHGVIESVLTFGNACHRFDERDGWTPANARATVLAFVLNIPEPLLDYLGPIADKEVAFVTKWDRRSWMEMSVNGGDKMTLAQLKRAYAERVAAEAA